MSDLLKKWIEFARADLEAAKIQFKYGKRLGSAYQITVFHCHQAIEKIFKAHLVAQNKEILKIHDLSRLRKMTDLEIPEEHRLFIDKLNPHYITPRYPDLPFQPKFSFLYNQTNTKDILAKTIKVFLWLENQLIQKK